MFEWSFLLKKLVAAFCMPLPLFCILISLAIILFWRRKYLFAKSLSIFSLLFLYLISIQASGDFLANKLEYQYPQYQKNQNAKHLDYVLVLGSGHTSDPKQPISSLLSSAGMSRLVEGIRVHRLNPGSKLLLSGYRFDDDISHAQALKNVALYFGVQAKDIILAEQVKDTQEEAKHWITFAQNKSLALITSASHMPRSMLLFKNIQKNSQHFGAIIPAPTNYLSASKPKKSWRSWFPSGRNMHTVERVWHEYLGLLWAKLVAKN